jgi:hypothetical protein
MFTPECQRQLDNLDKLIEYWTEVANPDGVNLQHYHTCGGVYCIGGWVAVSGLFEGVSATGNGSPKFYKQTFDESDRSRSAVTLYGYEVGEYLFGDDHLFDTRGGHPADGDHPDDTDWQVALARMHYAKDQLCRRSSDVYDTNPAEPKGPTK